MLVSLMAEVAGEGLCRLEIVEAESGWPVPGVELTTTHQVKFVSDNAGVVAFDLPELMGAETWLEIEGHGYGVDQDGFGYRGVRIVPEEGKTVRIEVKRELPAKRLGRITGAGLFGESQRFGEHGDWKEDGVLGCDTVQTVPWKDRLFWLWGDTTVARYPLGIFDTLGATTALRPVERWEPPLALNYDHFRSEEGNLRGIARMDSRGPVWLGGLVVLEDKEGTSHLVASHAKISHHVTAYEKGLCEWNESRAMFEPVATLWKEGDERRVLPDGHIVLWTDGEGKEWLIDASPFARMRCEATYEAWKDPERWEILDLSREVPARDGSTVTAHGGSMAWSGFLKKWVAIFTRRGGDTHLGEIWYAESDSPFGPWGNARKVATHANQTFYNPMIHDEWLGNDSPVLIFEGTYTNEFSGHETKTPRQHYNQLLYRIDLDDGSFTR